MSFRQQNNGSNGGNNNGDRWVPSEAFVNVYLDTKDENGVVVKTHKLGGIPLKMSKAWEGAVIKRLTEGGEEALTKMLGTVRLDFQRTDKKVEVGDLPF